MRRKPSSPSKPNPLPPTSNSHATNLEFVKVSSRESLSLFAYMRHINHRVCLMVRHFNVSASRNFANHNEFLSASVSLSSFQVLSSSGMSRVLAETVS
mgnify:CR=1 FL=1